MADVTPDEVVAFYESQREDERLLRDAGPLELERTLRLLRRLLRPASTVADIGGGTGRYAERLALEGHRVELVDAVPAHVEAAAARAGRPPRFGARLGDARTLPFPGESFDAVLLLGPLYHLGDRGGRLDALREAVRVCRPGGVVAAAGISRLAPLLDQVRRRVTEERALANALAEALGGRRVPPERRMSAFPDAYFHLPDELADELRDAGLEVEMVVGIEGPGWLRADVDEAWRDERARERMLQAAADAERAPQMTALSAHILAAGRRP